MKKVGLIVNRKKDPSLDMTRKVISAFNEKNISVYLYDKELSDVINNMTFLVSKNKLLKEVEAIICLGGDGTLLNVAAAFLDYNIPLMGINIGHLGFLTEIDEFDLSKNITLLYQDEFEIEERSMFKVCFQLGNKTINDYCLNDFVISRGSSPRLICVQAFVDDDLIDTFTGDGVIVATPTGSTAYSLSSGGPIADPSMKITLITPICPHNIYSRTFLVDSKKEVRIEVVTKDFYHGLATLDGQRSFGINDRLSAKISTADSSLKMIKLNKRSFYNVLRKKLYNRGEE